MDESEYDKSEQASAFKLQRARERGAIARGVDLGFFAALAALIAYAWLIGSSSAARIGLVAGKTFRDFSAFADSPAALMPQFAAMISAVVVPLMLFAGTIFAAALVFEFLQVGPVFSFQPLKPDFKRINPAQGLKRLFSWRMLIEAFKSVIKLAIYGAISWLVIDNALETVAPGAVDGRRLMGVLAAIGFKLLLFYAVAAMFIAVIDQILARREFAKKMRMSRREVKREHKDREGDPRFKQKRREFHDEFMKMAKSLRGARDADIILTNPTHYAVALRYLPDQMDSPMIVSRGSGALASRIRRIGFTYGVVMISDPPLARALFRTGILDGEIPENQYHAIADLYRNHRLLDSVQKDQKS
jgi:flagellar biosynthesis protein FlhB